jgi:hypothetical protein
VHWQAVRDPAEYYDSIEYMLSQLDSRMCFFKISFAMRRIAVGRVIFGAAVGGLCLSSRGPRQGHCRC